MYVPGLLEREVRSASEVAALVASHVRANRAQCATAMNESSSRSHSLVFIQVETSALGRDGETEKTTGRLVLIDLAGSERVKKSEAQGQSLKEAAHMSAPRHHHASSRAIAISTHLSD